MTAGEKQSGGEEVAAFRSKIDFCVCVYVCVYIFLSLSSCGFVGLEV